MKINGNNNNLSGNKITPEQQNNNINPSTSGKIIKIESVNTLGKGALSVNIESTKNLSPTKEQTQSAEQVTVSSNETLRAISDTNTVGVERAYIESTDNLNPARDSGNINLANYATVTELATEVSTRETADTLLQLNINSATEGVTTVANNLLTESSERKAADNTLQANINNLASDIADTYIPLTQKATANGVATLGAAGTIPLAQIPFTALSYLGSWDASTNTPTIADGTGTTGNLYIVSVAGTWNSITFFAGDWVLYNGTTWERVVNSNSVASVNGFTGAVTLTGTDIATSASDSTTITAALASRALTSALTDGSVTKLGTASVGSVSNPVYWSAGIPSACTSIAASLVTGTLATSNIPDLSATYQPLDADLTAIAAISGTSGLLKKTASNTWALDTNSYLTGNQSITLSGDITGSGTTAITTTLVASGVTAGTYGNSTGIPYVTVDTKGRVTAAGTYTGTIANSTTGNAATATTASNLSAASGTVILPSGTSDPSSPVVGQIWLRTDI
jgi:hypothetical protein